MDILIYVVWKISEFFYEWVIGSGINFDMVRFYFLISEKMNIVVNNVYGWIIGEYGDVSGMLFFFLLILIWFMYFLYFYY